MKNLSIPARAEIINFNDMLVFIDSAHNPQKLDAFFDLIESLELPKKPLIIFATKKSKNWQSIIPKLISASDEIFVTELFSSQPGYLQKYKVNPNEIVKNINEFGGTAMAFSSPEIALNNALNHVLPGQPIVITGSMYMLGELHDRLTALNE